MTKAMSLCADHPAGGQVLRGDAVVLPDLLELGRASRSGTASSARLVRLSCAVEGLGVRRAGRYSGLATIATSSTCRRRRRASARPARNSWAISGQSVVQTGSRKVSSTTLPRRLARVTGRPSWSVSGKPGPAGPAGALRRRWPAAMIGSAFRFADAAAIGAAPRRPGRRPRPRSPTGRRPGRSDSRSRCAAYRGRRAAAAASPGHPPGAAPAVLRVAAAAPAAGLRASVAGGRTARSTGSCCSGRCRARRRTRGPRSAPSPPGRTPARATAARGPPAGRRSGRPAPIAASAITTNRLTANPCAAAKDPKLADQGRRTAAAASGHALRPCAASVPGWPPDWCPARSRGPARPAAPPCRGRTRPSRPAAAGQPRGCARPARAARSARRPPVEQRRPRRAEQPGQAGREDPAERLAEHPHDQSPGHAGQPGEPGPGAARPRRAARCRCRPGSTPPRRPPGSGGRPTPSRRS